jgi:Anti-sigma-K factor rskA
LNLEKYYKTGNLEIKEIISSGLLELYVAGLASEAESKQVEQWSALYPEVKDELNAIEVALETYAAGNAVQPADHIKNKVMAGITGTNLADTASGTQKTIQSNGTTLQKAPVVAIWKRLAAASVILLAGAAIFSVLLVNKNKNKEKELAAAKTKINNAQTEINNAQAALQKVQQAHVTAHHNMEAMLSSSLVKINLQKTANAPDGCTAAIFWNKKTGEVYIDPCRMAKAPDGKTYQLWVIVNGKPVDAGIVKTGTSEEKYTIQKMKIFEKAEGFSVTLEKEGGSPTPTLDQTYVTGKVA